MISAFLFMTAMVGVIDGAVYLVRHERARRRAAKIVLPGLPPIDDAFPDDFGLCTEPTLPVRQPEPAIPF